MNYEKNITLRSYSDSARKQFSDAQNRLSEIEEGIQLRMDGKTRWKVAGSLFVTIMWLAAYIGAYIVAKELVDNRILLAVFCIVLGLMGFMIMDTVMDFAYYGKISSYKGTIHHLRNRVDVGKDAIEKNQDALLKSRAKGWNYVLRADSSIFDETESVQTEMANMESLQKGTINGAKNILFYTVIVAITVIGCIALFPMGNKIIQMWPGDALSSETLRIIDDVALLIAVLIEVPISVWIWGRTDCRVTNITLLATLAGPVIFLVLVGVGTLLVSILIIIVQLAALAVAAFCLSASSGG